ncbi:MAG TPA: FAD:protein FMN transferase [Casimicrobiaceae bacterium]|nr:FAD:protein FMN transferase [Casimicrobiaceae bacterium]
MDRARHREAVLTRDERAPSFGYRFAAMASTHELQIAGTDRRAADRAAALAIAEVKRIEAKYSRYRDDSVTTAINRAAGVTPVAIDDETAALLRYADRCHAVSGGLFDITSGVLRRAWDFKRIPPRLPSADEVAAALALIGWTRVEWSGERVWLPNAGMELDFGGIGKEYAADRAAAILRDAGIAHALVNLGGDVRAIGSRGDGTPWRIAIRDPRDGEAVVGTMLVDDEAIATSGDYERYVEVDGRRYCHIVDPRSGMPVGHWQSASVVAPLTILAGSYATIAMLAGDRAPDFLDTQRLRYLLIDSNGRLIANG